METRRIPVEEARKLAERRLTAEERVCFDLFSLILEREDALCRSDGARYLLAQSREDTPLWGWLAQELPEAAEDEAAACLAESLARCPALHVTLDPGRGQGVLRKAAERSGLTPETVLPMNVYACRKLQPLPLRGRAVVPREEHRPVMAALLRQMALDAEGQEVPEAAAADFAQAMVGSDRLLLWEDGDTLLFPADRSAKEKKRREAGEEFTAYYRLSLSGGEALPAFTLPFSVSSLKPLGEGKYLAIGSVDAQRPDYFEMTEKARAEVAKEYAEDKDYEVFDEIPFWMNGGGVINKRRQALFLITAEPWEIRKVTEDPYFSVDSAAVLGDYVFFSGRRYESRMPLAADALCRLNWKSGELVRFPLPEKCDLAPLAVGDELWAMATIDPAHGGNQNSDLYRVDRETGVNYLWHSTGHAGGMTPLLDREGKPIITTLLEEKE